MKKLLLLLSACSILCANEITLDTKFTDESGKSVSLYENTAPCQAGGLEPHWHQEVNITVHVSVRDLLGAEKMEPGVRYRVNSVSWVGHPDGWFVGGNRPRGLPTEKNTSSNPVSTSKRTANPVSSVRMMQRDSVSQAMTGWN